MQYYTSCQWIIQTMWASHLVERIKEKLMRNHGAKIRENNGYINDHSWNIQNGRLSGVWSLIMNIRYSRVSRRDSSRFLRLPSSINDVLFCQNLFN